MAITLKRQLSDHEKEIIIERVGRIDWVTGREIPPEEALHFDHLKPFARGGDSELNNIVPMSQETNLKKGRLTLEEYRTKLRIERFFATGQRLTLGNLLRHLKEVEDISSFGEKVSVSIVKGNVALKADDLTEYTYRVETCPTTGWNYFYAILPIELLDSDDDTDSELGLQPRYLIFDKVFGLYRHFLNHPVLQPSIGRMDGQKIRLFDGQHKVAGLLFTGRKQFECKVYLDADKRQLNQTNISAHDAFAQTRFFSSVMVMKLGAQFGKDFEDYRNESQDEVKTEARFLRWLQNKEDNQFTTGDLNKRLRSYLYNGVLEDSGNKLRPLISVENRSSKQTPLTIDQLEKSLLSDFLFREALDIDMTSADYRREVEFENLIFLMNCLHDNALHRWDASAAKNNHDQVSLERMFRSKSMMAWSEILCDAIAASLRLTDREEKSKLFLRDLTDEKKEAIAYTVRRLAGWQGWSAPVDSEIDRVLSDNAAAVRKWLKEKGLTTGYLMGASE